MSDDEQPKWEKVCGDRDEYTQRLSVPGGWLYRHRNLVQEGTLGSPTPWCSCLARTDRSERPSGAAPPAGARASIWWTFGVMGLQSHFDEGASRKWILQMIEIGQKSRETY